MKIAKCLSILFILVFLLRCNQKHLLPVPETRPSTLSYLVDNSNSDSTQISQPAGTKTSFTALISYGNPIPQRLLLTDNGITIQEFSLGHQPSSIKIEYLVPDSTTTTQIILMGELQSGRQTLVGQEITINVLPKTSKESEGPETVVEIDSATLLLQAKGETANQITQQAGKTASFTAVIDQRDEYPDIVRVINNGKIIQEHEIANAMTSIQIDYLIPVDTIAEQVLLTIELLEGEMVLDSQDFTVNVTPEKPVTSVADLVIDDIRFSIFVQALSQTGLLDDLRGEGPFTIFAPTNEAFEALMHELEIQQNELLALSYLTDILKYHIVSDKITSEKFSNGRRVKTLLGIDVMLGVSSNAHTINNIVINSLDWTTSNGTVHVVPKVLSPLNEVTVYEAAFITPPLPLNTNNSLTFFSSTDGQTYSKNEVDNNNEDISALIDFGYYYGGVHEATLVSPAAYPKVLYDLSSWSTLNQTLIRPGPLSQDFDNPYQTSSPLSIKNMFDRSDSSRETQTITNLSVGSVFTFRTADNRYGMLRVEAIDGTYNSADGITISVKVETPEGPCTCTN